MDLKKEISLSSLGIGKKKIKVPSKNSINLIVRETIRINPVIAVPAVIVICCAAVLISKFAVVDRLTDLNNAQNQVGSLQSQLNADYAEIESYGELQEKYAHYTFSGMNDTELTMASREEILSLLREQVLPYATVGSWSASYNTISIPITAGSLQEINVIVQRLNEDDRVNYCTIDTAKTNTRTTTYTAGTTTVEAVVEDEGTVTAQVTICLNDVAKGAFN